MPFDRKRYPPDWNQIVARIAQRSGGVCEWCGAVNGQPHPVTKSKVVLTTAHLGTVHADGSHGDKHDKQDCRDENLAHLCQRCHLNYDRDEHLQNARKTRVNKRREKARSAGQKELIDHECLTHEI